MQNHQERREFIKSGLIFISSAAFIGGGTIKFLTELNMIPLPYYRANSPIRRHLGLAKQESTALSISGKIYSKKNHQLLEKTQIEVWHCDEKGRFDMSSSAYAGRASLMTNSFGMYAFDTKLPGLYSIDHVKQMRRIFFRIKHTGYETFYTQLLFDSYGNSYIDGDHWDKCLDKSQACPKNSGNEKQRNIEFNICLKPDNGYFS